MIKQVIVMRKDLKMRRGKEISQGSHASSMWLMEKIRLLHEYNDLSVVELSEDELEWINGIYTKVCLQVNSEEELLAIHQNALDQGLESHLITDIGKTEFHDVPTITCCAIGPANEELINAVTGGLSLY